MARVVAKMSFEKIFLCRGFPNSPIDLHEFSHNYPIYLGSQAWIRVLFKTEILIENQTRCKLIKIWLHIIFKKEILILRTLNMRKSVLL